MNKSKDKHHPPEEAKKNAGAADNPVPANIEPAKEAPFGQETQSAATPTRSASSEASWRGEASERARSEAPVPKRHGEESERAEAGKSQKAAQEIDQLKDQLLRLRADFENFRKRSLREKGEIYENANEALMLDLLPVIDHLQLALNSAKEHLADSVFQEGLQLIADQLMNTLSKYGLNPFSSEKQPFDPNLHEAISCLPSETEPEGIILAQSRQGYRFNNKMLRPAQVVVSSGKSAPLQSEANSQQPAED